MGKGLRCRDCDMLIDELHGTDGRAVAVIASAEAGLCARSPRFGNSGSFAILDAIRRASSRVLRLQWLWRRADSFSPIPGGAEAIELPVEIDRPLPR
jgi:hypothetical protein